MTDKLRRLAAEATPRPWRLWDKRGWPTRAWADPPTSDKSKWTGPPLDKNSFGVIVNGINFTPPTFADAALIVEAVNRLEALLDVATEARIALPILSDFGRATRIAAGLGGPPASALRLKAALARLDALDE